MHLKIDSYKLSDNNDKKLLLITLTISIHRPLVYFNEVAYSSRRIQNLNLCILNSRKGSLMGFG